MAEPSAKPRSRAINYFWPALAFAALALFITKGAWLNGAALNDPKAAPRTVTPRGELRAEEKLNIALFKQASPAVVNITVLGVERDMFTLNQYQIPQGTGSGFVWDTAGNIITNFHVIQNADGAQVTLADQSNWKARVVGVAPDKDLAVLKIDAPANKLQRIPIGTSKDLQVGQNVFAIGNPFGLDQTLTTGIISAQPRDRIGDAPADSGRDSIRRGDQSGKLRRSAARQRGAADRGQHGDLQSVRHVGRDRFRDSRRHGQSDRAGAYSQR